MLARYFTPLALAASLIAAACAAAPDPAEPDARPALGLMTTLPLIWGEAGDIGEMLGHDAKAGWVRQALEARFTLEPLDTLEEASLAELDRVILAQPRALSATENVALDAWVRRGGRLLLFADPMLTRPSRFPVGDRRRPQDVVLLSPILSHWGLDLQFDDEQAEGERNIELETLTLPIDLAGRFRARSGDDCTVSAEGILVRCRIGRGSIVAIADAAVLDDPVSGSSDMRRDALNRLAALAFD